MAVGDEGESVGGIYIDVGVEDEGVLDRLSAIETALSNLSQKETIVKVNYVEEGSTTPKRAKNKTVDILASLQLEKDAAEKATKEADKPKIEVDLALANDAITKLQSQITEAFHDFSIKINVEYGGGAPHTPAEREEFAEATSLSAGRGRAGRRTVRSTGRRPAAGPVRTPEGVLAEATKALNELTTAYDAMQTDASATDRDRNKALGEINRLRRGINTIQNTPRETMLERLNPPVTEPAPLIEREEAPRKRGRQGMRSKTRLAPAVEAVEQASVVQPEAPVLPERQPTPEVPLPTSTRTGRRRRQEPTIKGYPYSEFTSVGKANLGYRVPAINIIPDEPQRAEAEEQAQRRAGREAQMLAGRSAGERGGSEFTPRARAYRSFDRAPIPTVAGARGVVQRGPAVAVEGVRVAPVETRINTLNATGEETGGLVLRGPIARGARVRQSEYARRRQGPEQTLAPGPRVGRKFLEPLPRNRVSRVPDASALGVLEPRADEIMHALARGEYGTRDEPYYEELNQEGRRVGKPRELTDYRRAQIAREGGRATPGETFGEGRFRIINPKDTARERLASLGELPTLVRQKIFGTGVEKGSAPEAERVGLMGTIVPGRGVLSATTGGYVNPSTGPGGAARSIHDTEEGNAANRARITYDRYMDALERIRSDNPTYAAAIEKNASTGLGYTVPRIRMQKTPGARTFPVPKRVSEPRRAMLEPALAQTGGDIAETRALMTAAPAEHGYQPRLEEAFEQYKTGYASREGLEAYLPEEAPVTAASTYHARSRQLVAQFKKEFQYKPRQALPEAFSAQLAAHRARIRRDTGYTVTDYDKISATGGAGTRRIPGAFEEAAALAEPAGRATTTATPPRRDYGPGETQVAELRSMLERLEGTPGSIRTAVRPGRAGTAEEQRAARQGGATQVTPRRLGEIEISRLLLRERQARDAKKPKIADEIRAIITGQTEPVEDPTRARALIERTRGYGVDIPEGQGLPSGPLPGISVRPAKTEAAAQGRLEAALQKQRGARRLLPAAYAAADAERQALEARGVNLSGAPILRDKPVLTGDELGAKVAASPIIGRAVRPVEPEEPQAAGTDTGNVRQALLRRLGGGLQARAATMPQTTGNVVNMAAWAARARPTPEPVPRPEPVAPVTIPQIPLAEEPKPAVGDTEAWTAMFRRRAAEAAAPPLTAEPGGPGAPPGETALRPSGGGAVDVNIVGSIPLEFKGGGGGAAAKTESKRAKMSEANEDIDPDKIREAAAGIRAKQPDITDERLAKILSGTGRGFERASVEATLGIIKPSGVAKTRNRVLAEAEEANPGLEFQQPERDDNQKSDARIRANAAILEARSLNPTRAFQTAVAAAFAKTLGGGSQFEARVQTLTRSLNVLGDFEEGLEKVNKALVTNEINIQANNAAAEEALRLPAGPERTRRLGTTAAAGTTLEAERGELIEQKAAQEPKVEAAQQKAAEDRRKLITPAGVVRGFAALGVGAIAGGLIFSAAQQAIQAAIGVLEEQATKAADALGGFGLTASKVTADLATAVRGAGGNVQGAVAGAAAPSGISTAALETLNQRGLGDRAQGIAAAQARVQESDLFRSANFLGGDRLKGGYDRSLFQGTGGILNSALFAPQPGLLERVSDDLTTGPLFNATAQQLIPPGPTGRAPRGAPGSPGVPRTNTGPAAEQQAAEAQAKAEADQAAKTTTYVNDLNDQLKRANSGFRYLTDATDEQKAAMKKSADELGQGNIADKLIKAGVAITGTGGRGLTGTEFGQAAADLAKGQLTVDPAVAIQQSMRGIEAAVDHLGRQAEHELTFTQPAQRSLEQLAAPPTPPGTGIIPTGNVDETKAVASGVAEIAQLQAKLNKEYQAGNDILKQVIPPDLLANITATGEAISKIQMGIANESAALQTHEYNNQLRIAERTLSDIAALTGKNYGYGKSQVGVLERQNFELSKQSTLLAQELQQRQINFQMAVAGFTVAGQSPEERAARIKDAKTQADFAQKQLDIQKKQSANQFQLFDLNNIRAAEDALAAIGLLKEGRQVAIDTKIAEEKLARLNKLQQIYVKQAGVALAKVEGEWTIAEDQLTQLEAAYGKAITGIAHRTLTTFMNSLDAMYRAIANAGTGPDDIGSNRRGYASGGMFSVSGPTDITVGEAGPETVTVMRNVRTVNAPTTGGGGGGGITININHPVVREDGDIQKLTQSVIRALNTRTALLGLR